MRVAKVLLSRRLHHGHWVVVASALALAIVVASGARSATARLACVANTPGPPTVVRLRAAGKVVVTATVTPCGPKGSYLSITPRSRVDHPGLEVFVRRGTCATMTSAPAYQIGTPESYPDFADPAITAARFHRTSFTVEFTRDGAVVPLACGEHRGSLPLPEPGKSMRDVQRAITLQHNSNGTYTGHGSNCCARARAQITPMDGGAATRVVVYAGSGSTGIHATLREGTCLHRIAGPQIALQSMDYDSTSKTIVQIPYAVFEAEHRSIEISMEGFPFDASVLVCLQT